MKKIIPVLSLLLLLCSCTFYEHAEDYEGGISFGYSALKRDCFVGQISYSDNGSTEIIIPNNFNDMPVVQLGGYTGRGVPTPFLVCRDESYFSPEYDMVYSCDDEYLQSIIDENTRVYVENVVFKITLPAGLKKIENTDLMSVSYAEKNDGQIRTIEVFRPVYYFEISVDNDTFYTKDGKLYYKETDEMFSDCIYEKNDYLIYRTEVC